MNNTVVVSVISVDYESNVRNVSRSVLDNGFPCQVVVMQDGFSSLLSNGVLQIGLLSNYLLPDSLFCTKYSSLWGWRRTQLYKAWAYHLVVQKGFDVLMLDVDRQIPPGFLLFIWESCYEIVALADGDHAGGVYLNFGLQWTRSSMSTRRMVHRVWNRTWNGWDRYVWNGEVKNTVSDARCCNWITSKPFQDKEAHKKKYSKNIGGVPIPSNLEPQEKLLYARKAHLLDDIQVLLVQLKVASEYEFAKKHNLPDEHFLIKSFFSSSGYQVSHYQSVPSKICMNYSMPVLTSPLIKKDIWTGTEFNSSGYLHHRTRSTCALSKHACGVNPNAVSESCSSTHSV